MKVMITYELPSVLSYQIQVENLIGLHAKSNYKSDRIPTLFGFRDRYESVLSVAITRHRRRVFQQAPISDLPKISMSISGSLLTV